MRTQFAKIFFEKLDKKKKKKKTYLRNFVTIDKENFHLSSAVNK